MTKVPLVLHRKSNTLSGRIFEVLPNAQFVVEITGPEHQGTKVRCYLSGRMRLYGIKVLLGDLVDIELPKSIHIKNSIGRISYRHK